ncbi:sensor histidine kinase [Microbispora sp. H10830]|uniref:sensor histidine kinase n=1 Tax=Microbispora sp. H10830 TaxID=2729109 RepID=UPI0016027906|nr:histidine kinase [Microbispora sp. H10830]
MTSTGSGILDRALPWALGSAVFVLCAGSVSGWAGVATTVPAPVALAVAAASAGATVAARRSVWPVTVVAAVAYVWLAMWPPAVVASYYAGLHLGRRQALWLYAAGASAVWALGGVVSRLSGGHRALAMGSSPNVLILGGALVGLPLVAGLWSRARRQVLDAVREQAEQLLREQVLRAEQARAQERARIAREMHDVVAHRVSLMVLHAGALEVGAPDERTAQAAALISDVGREALHNLREVLGVLRSPDASRDPQPTLADLDRLLEQSRALGLMVNRRDEGPARPLGHSAERTAYRVVQEALTNVHKHARGAETDVVVRYLPAELEVLIRNATSPTGEGFPGSGWGLVGLRERVELLGGTLEAGPHGGGFQVLARIPAA